jgi:formate hydrogenlyase subunit 3/multisubunit Na+/H+ antiporter MnhD subunit
LNLEIALIILAPLLSAAIMLILRLHRILLIIAMIGIWIGLFNLVIQIWNNDSQTFALSGWNAPIGIEWYADGLATLLLLITNFINSLITIYWLITTPLAQKLPPIHQPEVNDAILFYPLWLILWSGFNALLLAADLFTIYIALELITIATVSLLIFSKQLLITLHYYFTTFAASLTYLLGIAIIYATFGTLDIATLAQEVESLPTLWMAMLLITLSLLAKMGMLPFHFWLIMLLTTIPLRLAASFTTLIIGSIFYLLLRFWLEIFPAESFHLNAQILSMLGIITMIWGTSQAIRQSRWQRILAYNTLVQIGYLFTWLPLLSDAEPNSLAWQGGIYLILSFLLTQTATLLLSHEKPLTPFTITTALLITMTTIGIPPTSGFFAKWWLLQVAWHKQWSWAMILILGNLILMINLGKLFHAAITAKVQPFCRMPRLEESIPLLLMLATVVLGGFNDWISV